MGQEILGGSSESYAIAPGNPPPGNPMDLTPENDLLRNIHVSGTVTADGGFIPAPTGAVSSVFGRTGAVVAETGDYTAAQVGAAAFTSATAWTPTDASGAGLTFEAGTGGYYAVIGSLVFATFNINYPVNSSAVESVIGGLPFTASAGGPNAILWGGFVSVTSTGVGTTLYVAAGTRIVNPRAFNGAGIPNSALGGGYINGTAIYSTLP
jgi:hypothetical protein